MTSEFFNIILDVSGFAFLLFAGTIAAFTLIIIFVYAICEMISMWSRK